MSSARFYTERPTLTAEPSAVLAVPEQFAPVPSDWEVMVTDVRGSTRAVGEGRLNIVGLTAVGCIIAALNIGYREGIELPFFFGGDGATLLVPRALADRVVSALALHRDNARAQLDLDLRVGRVPLSEVYARGHRVALAKVDVNGAGMVLPFAIGDGLQHAEQTVKRDDAPTLSTPHDAELDLNGMECRWNDIAPPRRKKEIVCLIVSPISQERAASALSRVLGLIEGTYGSYAARNPVSRERLTYYKGFDRIDAEERLKYRNSDLKRRMHTWVWTIFSRPYFAFSATGRYYMERLVQLSHTLSVDGRLSTIMAGTPAQRASLEAALIGLEAGDDIRYGLEVCPSSVISCYVRDRRDDHIHFIDGQGGGYTRASITLKRKLALLG